MQAQKLTRESWSEDGVKRALQGLIDASEKVKASPAAATRNVEALLEDMTGQSTEALPQQDWDFRWGVHCQPSVMSAHKLQMCTNFKDPCVQHYGSEFFRQLRDEADDRFGTLLVPKHTRRLYGHSGAARVAPVSMAACNDCRSS